MNFTLTKPVSTSGIPGIAKSVIVPANTTMSVDIYACKTGNRATLKWFLSVEDNVNSKTRAMEVFAMRRDLNINHHKNNILGVSINFTLDVIINGSDVELIIQNNESVNLQIDLVRLQVI